MGSANKFGSILAVVIWGVDEALGDMRFRGSGGKPVDWLYDCSDGGGGIGELRKVVVMTGILLVALMP